MSDKTFNIGIQHYEPPLSQERVEQIWNTVGGGGAPPPAFLPDPENGRAPILDWKPGEWTNSAPTSDPAGWWFNGKHYVAPMSSPAGPPRGLTPRLVILDEVDWPVDLTAPRTLSSSVRLREARERLAKGEIVVRLHPAPRWRLRLLWLALALPVVVAIVWRLL